MLQDLVSIRFDGDAPRFPRVLELVWRLHGLPPDHPRYAELLDSLDQ